MGLADYIREAHIGAHLETELSFALRVGYVHHGEVMQDNGETEKVESLFRNVRDIANDEERQAIQLFEMFGTVEGIVREGRSPRAECVGNVLPESRESGIVNHIESSF